MEIFDNVSAVMPNSNGPKNAGSLGNTPKRPSSNKVPEHNQTKADIDVVEISQGAKNAIDNNSLKNVAPSGNTPKQPASNNVSTNNQTKPDIDVALISQGAKSTIEINNNKPSGSFEISNNRISYSVTDSNELVVKIIDKDTNEVVRQIPPEELVKMRAALDDALSQTSHEIEV